MEEVYRIRFKLMYESLQASIISAQCALDKSTVTATDTNELELIENKLRGANQRFVSEIHNFCKLSSEPNVEEISLFTSTQIQAEDLISEINVRVRRNNQNRQTFSTGSDHISITSKLPRMELAKFDGDILKWHQFWDQFSSNVDSRKISDVDKLLYLQSVLEGDAKGVIEGLDTTNKNYQIAVCTLKDRYGKQNAIIDAHYVALYRIKPASSNQVKECRHVLNEIERHLRVLSSLGEDVNHNHLRVMIIEKFPEDLVYELRMKLSGEDESIESIRKYLDHIISARETSNRLKRGTEVLNLDNKHLNDNFTLGSLHVKSEEIRHNKNTKYSAKHVKNKPKVDFRSLNKFNLLQKRRVDNSDRTGEPPIKKFRRCIFCEQDHFNDECSTYKTIQDRKTKLGRRCYACFAEGHRSENCRSKRTCWYCKKFGHNRALCPSKLIKSVRSNKTNNLHIRCDFNKTLLQTCLVNIRNLQCPSKYLKCRILLDCGSQRSYITESVAKSLKFPILETINLSIFTFGAKEPHQIKSSIVNFELTTRTGVTRIIHANIVPHITNGIVTPVFNDSAKITDDFRLRNFVLADDGSNGERVDILIGNDYYFSFMSHEKILVDENLFLVNSDFGWVWSGQINEKVDNLDQLTVVTYYQSTSKFNNKLTEPDLPLKFDNMKKLWDLEAIGITDSPNTTRDEEALKQFNETIKYKENRYEVQWPWIEFPPNLPTNIGLAYGRLNSLLKRLNQLQLVSYNKIIQEQLQKGIIEIVANTSAIQTHPVHYLPHHGVYSRDKPDKLRIVYDASAKTGDNRSLNECLHRGPLMLEDLTGLLIKFREHPIGLIADVEKAFLQLGLQDSDRDVTRFLWLKNTDCEVSQDNIVHFRFCRVPFGVISSPFLLNATVKYHLMKLKDDLMIQIAQDIYVDNIVTGASSISGALTLYKSARQSFNSLSMNLREWNSNSKELKSCIPAEFRSADSKQVKVLGMIWNTDSDCLSLKTNFLNSNLETINTKRDVLQTIASVYDPCGLAVPIMLPAKLFFQKLWKDKIKWDSKFSEKLLNEWRDIATKFYYLKEINIDRFYAKNQNFKTHDNIKYELHCFTDSSLQAYAASVYLRCSLGTNIIISFVIGKSRLVPLKDQDSLKIPRLELLGALIGSRLIKYVMKFLRHKISAQFLWTDSQIVLSWHESDKLLPPFISNRISEIKQNKNLQLRYVPTKLNPSDVGTKSDKVNSYNRWLEGPDFLLKESNEWPKIYPNRQDKIQTQSCLAGEVLTISSPKEKAGLVSAEALFINNDNTFNQLHTDETQQILKVQAQYFPKETKGNITDLARSLKLFFDSDNILRCKGRFNHSNLSYNQKEPILLPKTSDFTHKIILELHRNNYHVGVSHTLSLLRKKFWVPQGRSIVQKVIKKCSKCIKYGGGPFKLPAMPDLPEERVKLTLPFAFTGLDYFGPLFVDGNNKEKRWVCLFTCLAIRAIHMEVVKDLSAEECLLAIRRFVATRGIPRIIISDNASQFKLTADVLTSDYCILNKIRWRFIPELAPWFGGFYERLIGLVKHSLKRTLDKHLINDQKLCTVLKEIESVINTRPLTTVGAELEHILCPIDFLRVGGPVLARNSDREFFESATVTKTNLIDGWKHGQIILKEFSKMFMNQYLTSLRERNDKHRQPRVVVNREPKLSEYVQIKSDGNRAHWKVGKIVELIKGNDGQIRVAKVELVTGETFTRSIGHLYPLEIDDERTVPRTVGNEDKPLNPKNGTSGSIELKQPVQQSDGIGVESAESRDKVDPESISSRPEVSTQSAQGPVRRPTRLSAIKAREKVKQWTSQLMVNLFES